MEINPTIIDISINSNTVPLKGDNGKSAYEIAVGLGFTGTEQEWLNSFLDRANHIGTQDISTIDNLQAELDNKVNNSDIGVTVQPYDVNLVTYTQTEKDKLATIQEGAEVNINADWDATTGDAVILNKPTLGTIATCNIDEFATAEQGLKADSALQLDDLLSYETTTQLNDRDIANRDRANHTGTQAINTIENLQTILDGKQPTGDYATNTALNTKEPVIVTGTTEQYWRGDKSWQNLDKNVVGLSNVDNVSDLNKPISTATQSALNLKAPLNSPIFTGQLILPNNSRINNIEHFYQTTKPITRGDGSALVIGDRWWKTDEGTEWFWNGTYWLSTTEKTLGAATYAAVTTSIYSSPAYIHNSFLTNFEYSYNNIARVEGELSGWVMNVRGLRPDGAFGLGYINNLVLPNVVSAPYFVGNIPLNVLGSSDFAQCASGFRLFLTKETNATGLFFVASLYYREVYF